MLGQRGVERRVEHRHLRHVREQPQGDAQALEVRRVVQRRERHELLDVREQLVVHERRRGEHLAAVHDPVPDRADACVGQRGPVLVERVEHGTQRFLVVGEGALLLVLAVRAAVRERAAVLPDRLDDPVGGLVAGGGVDEGVLQRGRAGVDHQHQVAHAVASFWAWIAVIATVLTMSRTVAPRDRSLTGLRRPCSTGPTATAPAERCTAL